MRLLPIFLMLLPVTLACRTIWVTEIGKYGENGFSGVRNTVNTSLADVRNTSSLVTIEDKGPRQGMQLALDKTPASEQFMGMVEKTAPGVTEALAGALVSRGGSVVIDTLKGLIIDEDEVLEEAEEELVEELVEKERRRRTPAEKEEARAAREAAGKKRR